jgi:hypothetical protein
VRSDSAASLQDFEGVEGQMLTPSGLWTPVDSTGIAARRLDILVGGTIPDAAQLRTFAELRQSAAQGPNPVLLSIYAGH